MTIAISAIIPTYNRAQMVVEAVASVLAQTHRPLEVVVVDDGSTDDTHRQLERFGDRIIWLSQKNQGVSAARNAGVRRARGEFIAFLDSDDLWHPRKLEIQYACLRENPEVGLLACHVGRVSGLPARWGEVPADPLRIPSTRFALEDSVLCPRFATSSVIVRRSALPSAACFDTDLPTAEDRDLWIRIGARCQVRRLEVELAFARANHEDHLSAKPTCTEGNSLRMLDKVFCEVAQLKGRWVLKRRARSWALYQSGIMHTECGLHMLALRRVIHSLATWPLPHRVEADRRLKSLLVMGLRVAGIRN